MTLSDFLPKEFNTPEAIVDILPHGSGIDCEWGCGVQRNGDFVFNNSYHRMNDAGYYCGWIDFNVYLKLVRRTEIYELFGPLDGGKAMSVVAGDMEIDVTGFGKHHRADIADYVYDCVLQALVGRIFPHQVRFSFLNGEVEAIASLPTKDKTKLAYCTLAILRQLPVLENYNHTCIPDHLQEAALITAKACRAYMEK